MNPQNKPCCYNFQFNNEETDLVKLRKLAQLEVNWSHRCSVAKMGLTYLQSLCW